MEQASQTRPPILKNAHLEGAAPCPSSAWWAAGRGLSSPPRFDKVTFVSVDAGELLQMVERSARRPSRRPSAGPPVESL